MRVVRIIAALVCAGVSSSGSAAENAASVPDLSGQWGHDWFLLEPPAVGPGPVVHRFRTPGGAFDYAGLRFIGDDTNPILRREAADVVKGQGELSLSGTVPPNPGNQCWPQPPPFIVADQVGLQILQQKDKLTIIYMGDHEVRQIPFNLPHGKNAQAQWHGDSVARWEGDALVVDTTGIRKDPFSVVDLFGTPLTGRLHVIERYRLIDGALAAEAQSRILKNSSFGDPAQFPFEFLSPFYGRGPIDADTKRKGLQVEITVEDPTVFTTAWSARVTYRPVTGDWPELVC